MELLGNKTALKLLRILIAEPLKQYKEIELIKKAKTGKGSANLVVNELVKANILKEQRVGNAKLISLNLSNKTFFLIKNILDQQKLLKLNERTLAAILLLKEKVRQYCEVCILFGSQIADTATEESDIDLLIVSDHFENIHQERTKVEELFGVRFNLHEYNYLEEIEDKIKVDPFIKNTLFRGIILLGLDNLQMLFSKYQQINDFERILFFIDRIRAARRNYLQKDENTSKEIIKITKEQITYFILSEKNIKYVSKRDAEQAIKKIAEGRKLEKIEKLPIGKKIDGFEDFIFELLAEKIIMGEGYG
ncbi:nucleotidyltransferase domain-containing protein [Candidatus Woesearchaeota archaeon]|nr:nucleotidyltransferase domain-containing protein [Candidatus Woesearchaeota archaeon]